MFYYVQVFYVVFLSYCGGFVSCDSVWNQLDYFKFSKKIKELGKNRFFFILKLCGEYRFQGSKEELRFYS